jgi:hypothetical protein
MTSRSAYMKYKMSFHYNVTRCTAFILKTDVTLHYPKKRITPGWTKKKLSSTQQAT